MGKVKIDYDPESDVLYIYKSGAKVKFSVEFFDELVVDVGFDNKVVGVEIINASRVLKVSKQALKNAKDARLKTISKADGFGVIYGMKLRGVEIETKVLAPIARVLSR